MFESGIDMLKFTKRVLSIFVLFAVIFNLSLYDALGKNTALLLEEEPLEVPIGNFTNFNLIFDNDKISSINSGSQITFQGGNIPSFYAGPPVNWFSPEKYLLSLESLVGNCSTFTVQFKINYYFPNETTMTRFTISLGSNYNPKGENIPTEFLSIVLTYNEIRMQTVKVLERVKYFHLSSPINGSFIFKIQKTAKTLSCSFWDSDIQVTKTRKWSSGNYYLPLHNFTFAFYSKTVDNSLVISEINGTVVSENLDWQLLRKMALIYTTLEAVAVVILLLLIFSFWFGKIIMKNRAEARARRENKIDFQKYIHRIKTATQRAKQRKAELSAEELASLTPTVFEGVLEEGEICMICKIRLRKDKEILQCPLCGSLFHKEHLLEWLIEKDSCPVCKELLKQKK